MRPLALLAAALAVTAVPALACAAPPDPAPSPTASPEVPYDPTPHAVVAKMLAMAGVGRGDVVFDLGCGDGRIVIAAVKDRGAARGVCVDIDPQRTKESRANARQAGVEDRITFLTQDLFETDLQGATVVTLFLWPEVNSRLRPRLLETLRPGTRIVSYMHDMDDWKPEETARVDDVHGPRDVYLWRIPPRTRSH
jgi:tRNA G37 N-methylase Trm5